MIQSNSTTEQNAITQLKNGNIQGLETLVRKHQAQAIRAAYMVTHDLPLAEEVVQEAFLDVYNTAFAVT
ncbi:MAG: hypothetical protein HS099_18205 [Ardenticatenaceae bacterium]|nr:hypothetical protein [Ardenticatenaceae bacterium]